MTKGPYQILFEIARLSGIGNAAMTEYALWKEILIDLGGTFKASMLKTDVMNAILIIKGGVRADKEITILREIVKVIGGSWGLLDTKPRLLKKIYDNWT